MNGLNKGFLRKVIKMMCQTPATGEIIEDYPEDYPNPSCLIFGYNVNGRILHIVAGCDNINIYIITAYYPDTKKFEDDLKTRRKR